MQLKDDTIEANSGEDMADYFLYHARSADQRYGLAVEQARVDRFHVSVLMREPGWDVDGVLRMAAERPLHNAALSRFVRDGRGAWQIAAYDDVRHLEAAGLPVTEHQGERRGRD